MRQGVTIWRLLPIGLRPTPAPRRRAAAPPRLRQAQMRGA